MPALLLRRFFVAGLLFAAALTAEAAWPERAVRIAVPSAAGGSPDIVGRLVARELAKRRGQPVVVDNRLGAAGDIGMPAAMAAAPDGCTIGCGNNAMLVVHNAVQFLIDNIASVGPSVAAGKLRALATEERKQWGEVLRKSGGKVD